VLNTIGANAFDGSSFNGLLIQNIAHDTSVGSLSIGDEAFARRAGGGTANLTLGFGPHRSVSLGREVLLGSYRGGSATGYAEVGQLARRRIIVQRRSETGTGSPVAFFGVTGDYHNGTTAGLTGITDFGTALMAASGNSSNIHIEVQSY